MSSAQSLTCWQIAACHSAVRGDQWGSSGTLCYNWGRDTISARCVFNRTGVMVSRDGKRKQHERAECGSGLIPSQDDDPRPPGPPASAKTSLIPPICFKIAGTKPSLCLQALCQRFQYSVHFLWVTEEKMLPRRRQRKNQIKKQLCIRKPEALK